VPWDKHHPLAHRMADVETLHTLYFRQMQRLRQRGEALADCRLLGKPRGQRRRRIGAGKLQVARAIAARAGLDIHPASGDFSQRLGQQLRRGKREIKQDF